MAINKPDPERYCGPLVTLKVGSQEVVIQAHKNVLAKSGFFRACFRSKTFKEGWKKEVELTEEEVDVVRHLVHYLYTDTVTPQLNPDSGDLTIKDLEDLTTLFVAADRFIVEELKNTIVDLFICYHHTKCEPVPVGMINILDEAHLEDSPLKGFFLETMARNFTRRGRAVSAITVEDDVDFHDYINSLEETQSSNLKDLIALMTTIIRTNPAKQTKEELQTQLHTHIKTPPCQSCFKQKRKRKGDESD